MVTETKRDGLVGLSDQRLQAALGEFRRDVEFAVGTDGYFLNIGTRGSHTRVSLGFEPRASASPDVREGFYSQLREVLENAGYSIAGGRLSGYGGSLLIGKER